MSVRDAPLRPFATVSNNDHAERPCVTRCGGGECSGRSKLGLALSAPLVANTTTPDPTRRGHRRMSVVAMLAPCWTPPAPAVVVTVAPWEVSGMRSWTW